MGEHESFPFDEPSKPKPDYLVFSAHDAVSNAPQAPFAYSLRAEAINTIKNSLNQLRDTLPTNPEERARVCDEIDSQIRTAVADLDQQTKESSPTSEPVRHLERTLRDQLARCAEYSTILRNL